MAATLTLESIGPKGEALADAAAKATDVAVGFDPEFDCATFDSNLHDDEQLQGAILEALDGIDPEWSSHLRVVD